MYDESVAKVLSLKEEGSFVGSCWADLVKCKREIINKKNINIRIEHLSSDIDCTP